MMLCILPTAFAEDPGCVVIGADLNDTQVAVVYQIFGLTRGSVSELKVTNAEERQYLEGLVDDSVIGHNSISCVYVKVLEPGAGITVKTSNISWCSGAMYINALSTAGITDAEIVVAAPFDVSGTAALTGIYKAYEYITGGEIEQTVKEVSTEELTITGDLSDLIGSEEAASIINELKLILDETKNMSDDELRTTINEIAAGYSVSLEENEIRMIIKLCRELEKLDVNGIMSSVEKIQGTIDKIIDAKDKVEGFAGKVMNFFSKVAAFFDKASKFFAKFKK